MDDSMVAFEECYYAWENVPDNLATKTQLGKRGLKLAKNQRPASEFCSYIRGRSRPTYYDLYLVSEAIPKRKASPAQLAALKTAREKGTQLRTCPGCQYTIPLALYRGGQFRCRDCKARKAASAWASDVLADPGAIFLDTETTGLGPGAEVIEISVVNAAGEVLLDSLVRPRNGSMEDGDQSVHGITPEQLRSAPDFLDIWLPLAKLLKPASRVIAYGADNDREFIEGSIKAVGRVTPDWWEDVAWQCAMDQYSRWYGSWSSYYHDYRWQALNGSHRSLGDCWAMIEKIKEMLSDE